MAKYVVELLYGGEPQTQTVTADSEKDARERVWDIARRDPSVNQVGQARRIR